MNMFMLMPMFAMTLALLSMILKKKFFLSILLCLESILLNLLILNFSSSMMTGNTLYKSFSIFMLTISAVEASMGISLMALMSRKFYKKNMQNMKTLKK